MTGVQTCALPISAKAKSKIKHALKDQRRILIEEGKAVLKKKFFKLKLEFNQRTISDFTTWLKLSSSQELFFRVAKNAIDVSEIKNFIEYKNNPEKSPRKETTPTLEQIVSQARGKTDMLVIGDDMQKLDYKLSSCCKPIPGDDVFGFITVGEGIKIHRVNCPNAIQLLSNYAYRVVKAKWNSQQLISFLAGLKITGSDELGLVNNITKIISTQYNVNMRSINFDTDDGIFEGTIMVYVHDTDHLTQLITKLKKVKGVMTVERIDEENVQ